MTIKDQLKSLRLTIELISSTTNVLMHSIKKLEDRIKDEEQINTRTDKEI